MRIILKKRESGFCLKNATMIKIQDMLKRSRVLIKRTPFIILIPENSLKLGTVVLVMLNKMLVIVLTVELYSRSRPGS